MESRRKWKIRYYRERKRRKEEVEQLETKGQKLIEKLEKDVEQANEIINDQDYKYIDEIINEQYERRDYAQEILNLLKGEKE